MTRFPKLRKPARSSSVGKRSPGKGLMITAFLVGLVCIGLAAFFLQPRSSKEGPVSSAASKSSDPAPGYAGSVSCRECHENFYKLWAPSHHGLAMQPVTPKFLETRVKPQKKPTIIGGFQYQVRITDDGSGFVSEKGPQGENKYPINHAMGGKNVYYFLTPLKKGRLQVLPLAYDVRRQEWFDTTASMTRHFGDRARAKPVSWRDPLLTFNTACYSCHVSQLSTNYDPKTDTYRTVWAEPGINCETCHGPGEEHNRVCREAPKGTVPKDLKIIRGGKDFTLEQANSTCAPCHAKMIPLTTSFKPGERYFDNYDLVTLENPDFYPDGRDLGENFTYTTWRLSPCVQSGKLSCMHCHTSSGRYRFKDKAKANHACLPCHQKRVDQCAAHINHPADKPGTPTTCVACHMPMTEFARMRRTDHSMLPPTPAATLAFKSPNACNLCHKDKDAKWADQQVRKWRKRNYQAPVLHRAGLIAAARKRDWSRLPDMLSYLTRPDRQEIYTTSLIRLLAFCPDESKWPAITQALKDKSPLVRAAAAAALAGHPTPKTRDALLATLDDDYRLVRVRAAGALAAYPRELLHTSDKNRLDRAMAELLTSLQARPDDWTSHYNLGNFYADRREYQQALKSYAQASRLRPTSVLPWVNASMVYAKMGDHGQAEKALRQALKAEPRNAVAHFNLGLLLAETGSLQDAEKHLRTALATNPDFPEAAHNLGVLLAKDRPEEALKWSRQAHTLRPQEPKYAYTVAFYLQKAGNQEAAIATLQKLIQRHPTYAEASLFLGKIYEEQKKREAAREVYRRALRARGVPRRSRLALRARLRAITPPKRETEPEEGETDEEP